MHLFQQQFIRAAIEAKALQFGQFTLKSGRVSPYFFNLGAFKTGKALALLGESYAQCILAHQLSFDMLFGPAYKGIPLVTATSYALATEFDHDTPYCFDRKEVKDHGEGGELIGAPLNGEVLILDDVITKGTAIAHTMALLRKHGAKPAGIIIALDRQEVGQGQLSATQEIAKQYQIPVHSIITLTDILSYLAEGKVDISEEIQQAIVNYRNEYGLESLSNEIA